MNINTFEKMLKTSGKFCSISWKRDCKVYKNVEEKIEKETKGVNLRLGAQYDSMQVVKDKRESGELPNQNQGLFGFEWVKYPYILKSTKTGKLYLRVECAKNSKFYSKYFMNNVEVNKNDILDKLRSNEKASNTNKLTVFNIALDSIISFN